MKAEITKVSFMNWYLNEGSDQEQEEMLKSIGQRVADQLLEGKDASCTIQEIFDECETSIIPACNFVGYSEANYDEIGLYDVEVVLID